MMDYTLNELNIRSRLAIILKLKEAVGDKSLHYICHMSNDKTEKFTFE